jgi:molybdate/tungstate transport system substrate-binding protein
MKWIVAIFSLLIVYAAGCGEGGKMQFRIFHAGSLSVPFQELEKIFEEENPAIDVQREPYGSATAIRQVTELGRPADVLGSADYRLIDRLMVQADPKHADWNLLFARNSVGLTYVEKGDLTQENWAEVLRDPEVRVGMSNPNQDPCGYRGLFCMYLADEVLGEEGLFEELVLANSNVELEETDDGAVIRVPEDVRYTGRLVMRPKETDLIALLEEGAIDYLLLYQSVASQHGLGFFELPGEVNLSRADLAETYGKVSVLQYAGQPERETPVSGGPIVYGVTIPTSAPHPEEAARFVKLLVSERGRQVFQQNGQPPIEPPVLSPHSQVDTAPVEASKLSP